MKPLQPEERLRARNTRRRWIAAALATALPAVVLGAFVAPPDAVQGQIQRLMYLHVPAAWCAYLCFFLVFGASIRYLLKRTEGADRLAQAAAEAGVVLTVLTLATGSLWGAGTWGTWWVWDARVTATVAMGLVYLGYLAARALAAGPRGKTAVAITGAAGFAIVPVVHFSVLWWRTLHQPPTVLAPSLSPPLDPVMGAALAAALLAFTVLTAWVLYSRTGALRRTALPKQGPPSLLSAAIALPTTTAQSEPAVATLARNADTTPPQEASTGRREHEYVRS